MSSTRAFVLFCFFHIKFNMLWAVRNWNRDCQKQKSFIMKTINWHLSTDPSYKVRDRERKERAETRRGRVDIRQRREDREREGEGGRKERHTDRERKKE